MPKRQTIKTEHHEITRTKQVPFLGETKEKTIIRDRDTGNTGTGIARTTEAADDEAWTRLESENRAKR